MQDQHQDDSAEIVWCWNNSNIKANNSSTRQSEHRIIVRFNLGPVEIEGPCARGLFVKAIIQLRRSEIRCQIEIDTPM